MEESTRNVNVLNTKLRLLADENGRLRIQNATLSLNMMRDNTTPDETISTTPDSSLQVVPRWQRAPNNSPPDCLADQILLEFVSSKRRDSVLDGLSAAERAALYPVKPNLRALLHKGQRANDETSNIVGDIVHSYAEIECLPRKVAVHYVMWTLLKVRNP